MFPSSALLSLLLVAISSISSVSAGPVQRETGKFTLAFAAKIDTAGFANIADADRARAAALRTNAKSSKSGKRDGTVPATNTAVTYTASVGVGSGVYTLLIDTGSSNTWIGVDKAYEPGPDSQDTGETVSISYGSGSMSGEEFIDTVTLGSFSISAQSIGVASKTTGFGKQGRGEGIDGILGLGPTDLTAGTTSGGGNIPTVLDNLSSQGIISQNMVGISYVPTTTQSDTSGSLDFGAVDSTRFTDDINYVPITSTSPANAYWGIDQTITYGSAGTAILSSTAGIVDTGTTLILLATDAYDAYTKATGGSLDTTTGFLKISSDQYSNLSSLFFNIGGVTYELSANAQIWPRSLNSVIGGESGAIYLVVSDIGTSSGQGLDFINGYTFLERFYSVYDTSTSQVGFATTTYTDAETN